jgi:lipoyl(octanoyl) transferase
MIAIDQSLPEMWVCHLGTIPYRDALATQLDIRERRLSGELPDTLLLLEHPPVYTRGRRSAPSELGTPGPDGRGEDGLRAVCGIEVVDTDRGGRVTYHGPGQLVGYPIVRIHDVGRYLRTIESAILAALADYDIHARSRCAEGPDYTGVWVQDRKIASIGVHVSRGIATHGFAVNVDMDLDPFSWVIACGLPDVTMTSIARELPSGHVLDPDGFRARMSRHFCAVHSRRPRNVSPRELGIDISPQPDQPAPVASSSHPAPMRGRTPRAHGPRTSTARADAPHESPTSDTAASVIAHGAPV